MSLINNDGKVNILSTIPYGDNFLEAVDLLGIKNGALIIISVQHTITVQGNVNYFPAVEIIAGDAIPNKQWKADYVIGKPLGNKGLANKILEDHLDLEWSKISSRCTCWAVRTKEWYCKIPRPRRNSKATR